LLLNATDPFRDAFLKTSKLGAGQLGVELEVIPVNGMEELASAFDIAASVRADAAVVQPSLPIARAAKLALAHRLPATSLNPAFPKAGGLMSYAADYAEVWRVMAQFYVVKILKGTKPADLPVSQPSKLDLIINLKTSKELGLTIPPSVLALVNEIIDDK
jgi:putative ABC transport system substrate-binding protein